MALSTLVPSTVSTISLLAKSPIPSLQVWALHGLLLTVEAAGLSYVSHVQVLSFFISPVLSNVTKIWSIYIIYYKFIIYLQATLGLALDILLSEENGWVVLQQEIGHLINAIVAVLGPELHPGSIFFSRCKVFFFNFSFSFLFYDNNSTAQKIYFCYMPAIDCLFLYSLSLQR